MLATAAASTKGLGKPLRSPTYSGQALWSGRWQYGRLQKMREGEQAQLPHAWPDAVVGLEELLASRQTLVVQGMEN